MTQIDPYSLTTVPIEQLANGTPMKSATGFVWARGSQHYLITNWHVITGRDARTGELKTEAQPDTLRCLFNVQIGDFGKQQFDIKIRNDDNKPLWFTDVSRGRGCDVVAVPLKMSGNDPIMNMYPINALKPEEDLAIHIGMDAFVLGYPFGAIPPGYPVWKRGSIASEPDLTRIGTGYLLVDTASRPGMSGAPVIRRSWGYHLLTADRMSMTTTPASKFIGVYSGRLHTADPGDAQLGIVWPVEDIENIIDGATLDTQFT